MNDTLNPKLFENRKLKPDVRQAILDIVEQFKEYIEFPINILDIRIVGSNAAYNYNDKSDLDIHLVVNFDELSNNNDLIQALFNSEKKLFNDTFDITIKGLDAELYVEDVNTGAISNGIYSVLQDCWIKFPKILDLDNISIDMLGSDTLFFKYQEKCEQMLENKDNVSIEEVNELIDKIYMLRKNGLAKSGEYSNGNLAFKSLRNEGYIEQLIDLKNDLISKELSLEKLDRERNFNYDY